MVRMGAAAGAVSFHFSEATGRNRPDLSGGERPQFVAFIVPEE